MRRFLVGLAIAVAAAVLVQAASARNPGGRNYGGAIFSAGVSGKDGGRKAALVPLTPALDPLVRVSDDSGLPDTLASWELNQSGRAFVNSETEPWVDVNPANADNLVGFFQEDRWSTGGARNVTFAWSDDGGATWTNVPAPGLTRHFGGAVLGEPKDKPQWWLAATDDVAQEIHAALNDRQYGRAMRKVMDVADQINRYFDEKQPWALAKDPARRDELHRVVSDCIVGFKNLSVFLAPVLPETTRAAAQFRTVLQLRPDDPLAETELAALNPQGRAG